MGPRVRKENGKEGRKGIKGREGKEMEGEVGEEGRRAGRKEEKDHGSFQKSARMVQANPSTQEEQFD